MCATGGVSRRWGNTVPPARRSAAAGRLHAPICLRCTSVLQCTGATRPPAWLLISSTTTAPSLAAAAYIHAYLRGLPREQGRRAHRRTESSGDTLRPAFPAALCHPTKRLRMRTVGHPPGGATPLHSPARQLDMALEGHVTSRIPAAVQFVLWANLSETPVSTSVHLYLDGESPRSPVG